MGSSALINPLDPQTRSSLPPREHASRVPYGQIAARHCHRASPGHAAQSPLRVSMRHRQQRKHRAAPDPPGRGAGIATSRHFASKHCPRPLAPEPQSARLNPHRPSPTRPSLRTCADSGSVCPTALRLSRNSAAAVAEIPGKDDLFQQLRTIHQQSVNSVAFCLGSM